MVRITLNNGATSVTINKFVLLVFGLLCSTLSLFAQTDSCSTSPDGEVIVNGTSCSFVTFNKSFDARNGNAYWLNTALAACNAATSVDTWGWFTAISTSTTIRYESTELGVAPILHLFNQCNPIMSDIGCAYNPGTGLAEVTIATVIGQAYHFRLQAKDSDGPYPGRVCIFNNAIVPAPTITSLATSSGCPGSSLVINGTNLLSANAVKIGGTPAQIISKNESSVTVNVGLGTTGTVEVTTQGGTATSIASFTVLSGGSSDPLGSPCNPFTSLSQVRTATPNGQYSFVLNGNVFNSRIENGFLLIANDVGAALSLDLQELSNLSVTTRGIVSSGVLSNLGNVSKVRIKSSDGVLDVETTDPTIIARVKAGQTIHQGQADNVLNDSWAGTSAANIKEDAGCPTSFGASLKGNLIHTCGSFNGMNWIPNIGYRRINDSQGDVATGVSFGLWVEGVPSLQVIAQTNAAQNITSSTVTLTGEVNPRLLTGTYEFELGPTTVYNQTIVATPPSGSGDAVVPITADVTGLQQNTTYHYRVKVTTADGISYGNDQTFTTLSINAPPTGNLIHNFEFNGNLNDSQPTGELFSIPVPCTNSFGTNPNQWNWTATRSPGGGLFLATANLPNPENYTLALDFSFSDVSGKRKILSFGDFFENKGVYFLSGGIDQVDGSIYGFGTLNANTFYKLILTRDATTKELKTYIIGPSGVLQLLGTLTDTNNDAVPINSSASNRDFTFFLDDASTNNEYTPSGSVRFIKMWDAPLSEAQLTTLFPSPLPTITSLSTLSGCQGSSLIINGANLTGVQSVTIGGTAATVVSTTATSVTVTVGSGTTGTVSVTSPSGTATSTEVYTVASGGALGSVCNPFTNVNQVTDATPNGLYHFDLNGNKFETKVENGWVLVLNDSGASVKQGLQVVNTLDVTTRGILSNSVLSNLGDFNNINVKSSNGVVDAFSNNATLVSRLKASQTLHQGSNDNAINDSWTGIGAVYLTTNATCPSGDGSALNGSVIHICGPSNTLNWIPNRGVREITDAAGFVGAGISFGLWIKKVATPTILSLSSLNGCIGATLVINGTNLATTQTVTVGGTAATVISATETSVTVKIGNGTTGTVQLTTLGGSVTSAETYTISTVFNPSEPLGTGCNPFTSIQQITPATPNGLYFFNLGGNAFETKVEGGWVLVLNDVGASVKQGLQVVNSLDVTTRGILSNSALSNLGNVNAVKVKSSDGVLDAVSSNSAIISRVKAGQTIHKGLVDNAINDSWIGASASSLTGDATCTNTSTDITLNLNVLQLCGNVNGVSWIPIAGERRISFNNGDVADNVSFGLWVKQASPVAGISGRNLWLKANEGVTNSGANVTGWTDQTGTNTFTKQGTIGYQTNGINFNPTASFSNGYTTGVLPPNRLEGNTDINVVQAFAVYKNATSSPARTTSLFGRFDGNNNVTTGLFLGPTNDNTYVYFELNAIADAYLSFPSSINYDKFNLQTIDVSPTVTPFAKAWTNGKNSLVEATPTGGIEYMAIPLTPLIGGTKNSSFFNFNGEVAEIITYNTGLSTFDKIKVESYLAVKYGITLDESVNNYVSSSGSSIWEYRTHWHDVFGIGKDDAISLNQSQSNSINTGSGDGTGQSGKGNIVLSDPTSLDDGDFLMMGHDNAALTEQTTEVPKAGQNRIAREWRVKRSGDPGTVDLSFDIAGLTFSGSTASQFKLLIDADGDFNSGATSVSAGSLSGSKVVFNGVTLPDGFYLTIVTKTPGPGVTGASLWLKANEGVTNSGANLTGWADQTNTNTFTKVGTIGYQNNAINFNQSVVFKNPENKINLPVNRLDGNTDILYVDGFAVYKSNRTKSTLIGGVNAGAKYGQGIFVSDGVPQVLVGSGANSAHSQFNNPNLSSYNIANLDVSLTTSPFATGRLNGLPQTLSHSGGQAFTSLNVKPMIGGTNNKRDPGGWFDFEGEVAEVVLFPSSLTLVDKVKVESYLAIKYGITLAPSVVSYVNSLGTVLWNDTKYWHDVFGIGKDDASSLNQSQSNSINTGSGDGKGQSGKGNIVLSDPTSLNDGDFLMMGHDNAALTEQTTDLPANLSGKKRLSREWKVKKTNTPGTYNLSFDTTGLCLSASTAADFKLLVDSDEDGEFIAATTIDAASYANNILYFTGVDLPNNAVFTFLTSPPTIQLTSAVGTDAQTVCANTALTSIVYTTSKITNAVVTDLPAGVSANFSSNTLTISGTPTASGVFNYTIQLSSTQCPPLADVKGTITVTTLPNKPSITTSGPTSFCAPGSVVLTSSAATGNQWYKDRVAIVGATGTSYTATDTNTYTVIVTQNGCISQESDLVEVTANIASSAPTLSANGNTVICEGGSVRLHTSSLTGNKWFKNGVEIPGETGRDYNATSTGTYTVETINTAGCVSGLSTPIQVTVNPNKIVAPITGADSVCKGSSITLSSTTKTGVWNSSNTGIASIDGSGVVTGVSAGTVTITYSEANSSGCVTSVSKTITVIAQPIQPTITASGVTSFCSPATVTLSSSATTGNQWYKDGNAITGATDSVYTTADSGSYTVISTIDGCASAESAAVVVTVSVPPAVDPIAGAAVVCAGNTIQLSNTILKGVWSTSNTSIATVDGSGRVTGVSTGIATITFTVTTKFGCATSVSKDITVIALPSKPSITAASSTSFCAPGSVVLTSSASTGNQWYKDGTIIAGATTSSYTAADSGIYTVIVTQNGCVSVESDQVTVTANVTPSVPTLNATGNTIICEGGSVRLHTSSLTDNIWFKDGLVIPGVTGSDYIATTTGTYTVESSNTSGCVSGLSVPIVVTINPNRIVAPITGADRVCANASITLSNATSGGVWSSSNTGIASIDGSGEVTGIIGGTVTITYSASNTSGCVTSVSKTITVTPEPVTPVIATSGPTSFCLPGSVVLSSSATTGNQWYKNGGPIAGATASVYTATDSGSYTVISTQSGCSSNESGAVVVQANVVPVLDPITGADVVCTSTTTLLSNTFPRGVWSSSNTGIATIDGSGLLTGISAGRVTITYTITSRLSGCSSTVSKEITVSTLPSKPSITTSGATSFCAPGSVVLRSSASSGNQWYKDGTAITGATTNSYTATDSGIYTVIVTQNSCVSLESNQVTVTANATPSVPTLNATGNTVICEGASVRLHTSSVTGNKWFKDGVEILGETGSDYIATTTGTYTVESINTTGCVSGLSVPIVVTVNPNPIVVPITGADRVCANASITLSNATAGGVWSSSNTGIATIDGSGEVTGIIGGTVSISYSVTSSSGCVTSVTKTIMVTQEPVTPVIGTSGPTTFCIPGSVVLSSSATTGNQWYKDGLPIAGATANVYTATDSGSYRVISTQNGCSSIVSGAVVVQANVVPVLDPITGADVVCTSTTSLLSNTIPRGVWSSSNTGIATIDGSGLLTGISAGRVTITYTFTARLSGCSSSVSKEITVGTLPSKPSISTSGATSFCTPGSVVLRSSASSGNQWYKDGTAIAGATTNSYTATDSGSYSVIVTQNSCVSLESDQVTVSANATPSIPTLNATGNTVICEGASLRLHTSSLTGNKWFKNGIEIPGETGSDYIVTTSGSYTVETINTTGCVSGTSAPILVTVDPNRIVAPITGADRVCANASITLSNTTAGGVWSSSNTGIATIDGSGEVTGIIGGTVSISYSVTNSSGCVTSVSKTITVTPEPVTPVIATSGPTSFCLPGSVVLSSSATTGNQWYKDGLPIVGATASVYTATDSGSYSVISTQNGCSSIDSGAVVVRANGLPFLDPITGADVVCTSTTTLLSNTIPRGVWSSSNTGIATIDGSGLLAGISAGRVTITYTFTSRLSGCSSTVSKEITVSTLPSKPSISKSGATSFCAPGSVVLRSSASSGNQWYKDGTIIVGATASTYTATDSGIYSVIVTQNSCVSLESDQVTVTANAIPSVPTLNATGNTVICEGASVRLHTSSVTGNKWFKNGIEIPGVTGSDYIATTTGTYTVETINATGCVSGTSAPILVTVNPNKIVASITGADRVCANASITLSNATAGGVWSSSNSGIATVDGSGEVTGIIGGTVTITYSASNTSGCVTSVSKTITVTPEPVTPVIGTSGPTTFCIPGSVVLSSSATTGNQWYKDGLPIVGATASVYTATDSGSYSVISTQNGCSSIESGAVVVQANVVPVLDPITGADLVCTSTTTLLSNTFPRGVWSSSNTGIATIDGSGLLTGISAGRVTITYTFTARLSGCSSTVSKEITVSTLPRKPSVTAASSTSFCAPGSVVLRSSANTGNQWFKEGVAIQGATANNYTATDSGIYTLVVTQNGCVSLESDQVTVTANATPSDPTLNATGNTIICEGASVRLHTSSPSGNIWFKDGVEIPGETGSDYIATTTGTYTVETINTTGCVSGLSAPILVTVDPNRIVAPITGADRVCEGSSITLASTTTAGVWSSSNTGIASIDGSGVVTGVSAGTVTITYSASNTSGCTTSVSKTITVIAQPIQPTITASGVTSFCSPATVTLTSSATTGNQWYKDGAAITGATARVYTASDSGSYTVSAVNGCSSIESIPVVVTVSVPPVVDPIVGAAVVCAGNTIQLSNTILKGVWSTSNTGIATIDGSGLLTGVSAGTATIIFTVTTKFGCVTSVSKDITVRGLPNKPSITPSGATSFCAPGSVVLRSSATTGNQWYKDGTAIVGVTTSSYTVTVSGIYTVIVTQNGCVSIESDQVTVTANATPSVPTLNATGNTIICEGGSVRLHTSSVTDNIWFKDGLVIPGVTGSDYNATTTGTYTVESSNISGCVSGLSVPIVVTVNPNRIVAPITGVDRVCEGSSITLSSTTTAGVWSSSNTGIASIDGSGVVTGLSAGRVTITYSVTNAAGCTTSVSKLMTIISQTIKPTITPASSTSFCAPGSVVLRSSATTGNQWYKDGSTITGAITSSYTATDSGIYSVIVTQNSCASEMSDGVLVTANATPGIPIIRSSRNTTVCEGTSVRLYTSSTTGNQWLKDGLVIAGATGSEYFATTSGSYTLETINATGCVSGVSTVIQVVVSPNLVVTPITGTDTVCAGSSILLSNSTTGGVWSTSNTGIATVDGSGLVTGVSAGSVTITYSVTNAAGCTTSVSKSLTIIAQPIQPTITPASSTSFCTPGLVILNSSVSTGNQWFKDGTAILGATASSYTATTSGSYTVQVTQNSCSSVVSNVILVTANALPVLGPISGPNSLNVGSSITLTNGTSAGVWSSNNNAVATITPSGVVTGISSGSVIISYTVTNGAACTSVVTKTITVLDFVLNAVDDDFTSTPFDASKEQVLDVLANDKENNGTINAQSIVVTIVDNDGLQGVTVDSQGRVVIPAGSAIGIYILTYSICDKLNANNCSTAMITVELKDPCDFDDSAAGCDVVARNAISPNNDGLNDVFIIDRIENYPDNTVEIYNRWGQLVFKMNGYNNSSKVFVGNAEGAGVNDKNANLASGTYYYVIKYKKPISGAMKQKVGFLYISY